MIAARPSRSRWLMTLADLALLLVGFFAMVHVVDARGAEARAKMIEAIRAGFGGVEAPVTMDINRVDSFAAGSVDAVYDAAALAAWAKAAAGDPRSRLVVSGTGDDLSLAARRAEGIAAALAESGALPANRIDVEAHGGAGNGRVDLGIRFQP